MLYYRISEIADLIGTSRQTIYTLIKKRHIKAIKLANIWLVPEADYLQIKGTYEPNKQTHRFRRTRDERFKKYHIEGSEEHKSRSTDQ